ncbi:rhomboid family intramembrane serine protease [Phytohabitans sp. LJ34]|uniref:rhomboid family intramembrane serine protease n=1 Tax=Phytohabitans sp. LJ34 TaxID=3452217 RepID=UPI003F892810
MNGRLWARGRSRAPRLTLLTLIALAVAVVAVLVQYTVPDAVPLLERDPDGLREGELWRVVTPLLVQTLGWYQVVANLASLAVVGVVAEWVLGRARWLVSLAAGTAGGQIAAYVWHEPGGGSSIAICGLAGGLVVTLLARRTPPHRLAAEAVVYYVAALAGWGLLGPAGAVAACVAAGLGIRGLEWAAGAATAHRVALAGAVACALGLATLGDLHGASLTASMAVTAALTTWDRRRGGLLRSGGQGSAGGGADHERLSG